MICTCADKLTLSVRTKLKSSQRLAKLTRKTSTSIPSQVKVNCNLSQAASNSPTGNSAVDGEQKNKISSFKDKDNNVGAGSRQGGREKGLRSWQIHSYSGIGDLQLTDKARMPVIKLPTDVLIKIHAASVNPIDLAMTKGYGAEMINILRNTEYGIAGFPKLPLPRSRKSKALIEFPLTLGRDFSGVIAETGHGVNELKIGDEVYGVIGVQRNGSHADYTVAASDTIRRKPKNLSFIEAASIPYVGVTSWSAIRVTGAFVNLNHKKFLVLGGSGGVGTFTVQYLKSQGAQVITTCSTDAVALMEGLRCDFVVDYKQKDFVAHIKNHAPFDCILDLTGPGNDKASEVRKLLKPMTGQFITLSPPFLSNIDKFGVIGGAVKNLNDLVIGNMKSMSTDRVPTKWAFFIPNGCALDTFTDLIERNLIKPVVERIFKFSDLPAAYQKLEDGHLRGKIVIDME